MGAQRLHLADVTGSCALGRPLSQGSAPRSQRRQRPLFKRLPCGADSGCTVGPVILLRRLGDGSGWQALACPTFVIPLESAYLQSMDLLGRVKRAKPGTRL